ncbi:hypothetical protein N9544_08300 [Flavobacteriales bacterium]|nr:hypothetical protein [Flavobacteriales bacterium]
MKKLILITISSAVLLFSCNSEPAKPIEETTNPLEQFLATNLDSLDEMELYYYMEELEKRLMNEDSLELSKAYSVKMLESAQKHSSNFTKSEHRREALRKGVRAAMGLNQDYEAVRLNTIIIDENSTDTTIIEEMNLRAFLYDKMNSKEEAKKAINEIIEKFPSHSSIDNHKARLKTIDLSDEELMELFEKKNAE